MKYKTKSRENLYEDRSGPAPGPLAPRSRAASNQGRWLIILAGGESSLLPSAPAAGCRS